MLKLCLPNMNTVIPILSFLLLIAFLRAMLVSGLSCYCLHDPDCEDWTALEIVPRNHPGLSEEKCAKPVVSSETYSTQNKLLSVDTVYIAEFDVKCQGETEDLNLYAEVNDQLVPVAFSPEANKYQVSWSSEHKKAKVGDIPIKVYDEEGYAAYRKAQRSGESVSKVEPLITINLHHRGARREGLYVQTEFISAVAALLIWWVANNIKGKIME